MLQLLDWRLIVNEDEFAVVEVILNDYFTSEGDTSLQSSRMLHSNTSKKASYEEDIEMTDLSLDFALDQTLNTQPIYEPSMNEKSLKNYQKRSRSSEAKVFCPNKFESPLPGTCWNDVAHLETNISSPKVLAPQ